MNIKYSVLDCIRTVELTWPRAKIYEERLPRNSLEYCPPGRRRKGGPRNSQMQKVATGMREGELTTWVGSTEKVGEDIIK